mmetsp:Transcript_4124/g.7882  ORF Transcript_4124/g.7882 Transcript_4124/m.7882 type:complete len:342 (+) Transcript_4124:103-1128(+)|eukprot:CAMPEP_0184524182 /NCGR_PEP_ID=MMETSP0198_2-20121128/9353_1 /TAXON_ID=1112570 /ORGANISM="Thraustochytrium sp., Strain LLF1b" /LENGTH=341 /DNA_ID=CAMNT_0026915407 /DNA_START=88 /DNA_END=1113 /DNA_ORIENTATION=+
MVKRKGDAQGGRGRKKAVIDTGDVQITNQTEAAGFARMNVEAANNTANYKISNKVGARPVNGSRRKRDAEPALTKFFEQTDAMNKLTIDQIVQLGETVISVMNNAKKESLSGDSAASKDPFRINWQAVGAKGIDWDSNLMRTAWSFLCLGRLPLPTTESEASSNWAFSLDQIDEMCCDNPFANWFSVREDWKSRKMDYFVQKVQLKKAELEHQNQCKLLKQKVAHERQIALSLVGLSSPLYNAEEGKWRSDEPSTMKHDPGFLAWVRDHKAEEVTSVLAIVKKITEGIINESERRAKNVYIEEEVADFYKSLEVQFTQIGFTERELYKMRGELLLEQLVDQ